MHSLQRWITLISIVTMTVLIGLAGFTSLSKAQSGGTTTRVSVASDGIEGNSDSYYSSVNDDGRFVAFTSPSNNLVVNDTNFFNDVFVHNRQTGITERVSIATNGNEGNGQSVFAVMNSEARYVVFDSLASNLVPNDTNGEWDIFVRDRILSTTERVSLATNSNQGNYASVRPDVNADGRFVVFISFANTLVPNDNNNMSDVFLRDRTLGTTTRVNINSAGTETNGPSDNVSINADGRYVVFGSNASNLVSNDTNDTYDIFLRDLETEITTRVSVATGGMQSNGTSTIPTISEDGRYIAFQSDANNLVPNDNNNNSDIFVHDRLTNSTELASVSITGGTGDSGSLHPDLSSNGRYVVFKSGATDLVVGDNNNTCDNNGDGNYNENCGDIFLRDSLLQETHLLSVSSDNVQGNGSSSTYFVSISDDGNLVAFDSYASNLAQGDTNNFCDTDGDSNFDDNCSDVFIREWIKLTPTPTSEPATPTPTPTNGPGTPTSTPTDEPATPTSTPTGEPATPTPTPTGIPATITPTIVPTLTPTVTQSPTSGEVYIPSVLRQYAFATSVPITPTPTFTPQPTCEVLDHEPNNLYIEADSNLSLCQGATVNGSVSRTSDVNDIYRMEVEGGGGTVQINLTNLPAGADYDLYLDAGPGNNLAFSTNSGSVNESITFAVTQGRYYIRVVARTDGNPNTYQLRWTQP
jgi:hypothetical protein